ncbi:pyruvate dehydrogenase complex dihydrolipoamide acetyltransferase [Halocola ammonii]
MAEIVKMPKLSDTMEEGVVAEWHKKVGDQVESGEVLAEIETDKATMEFESFQDGTLLYIGVEKGDSAPVDSILAILGDEGEDVDKILKEADSKTSGGEKKEDDSKKSENKEEKQEQEKTEKKEEEKKPEEKKPAEKKEQRPAATADTSDAEGRIKASPLAKSLAEEKGIDISRVRGTGDNGRIIKRDIENFREDKAVSPTGPAVTTRGAVGEESYREENVSQMRKTIARRLSESKFEAPHFYLTIEIDMDNAMQARKMVNENSDLKISFNDMVIKAAAVALRQHPQVNSSWQGDTIRYNDHVHVGVAVAVDEGLLVPVVRFADGKTMSQINGEVKEYAEKARNKKLQPQDWEGNTFTISNLGMFGIEEFTAIINPPDSCIMAVGGIIQKPVVKNGEVVPGNRMKVTLSCDHRVVDGVTGAKFLDTFKKMMENPVMMIA